MAGMREMLEKGEWPTKPPIGYDISRENGKREIVINEKGLLLKAAFKQKLKYNTSFKELSIYLKKRGFDITYKRLSYISRNVFYTGYMAHKSLDGQILKGNHQAILTKDEFLRLNNQLSQQYDNRTKSNKKEDDRLPLKGHLICSCCNTKLTGYLVKKKNLFYYKCNTIGCKHNKSAKQLHDSWEDHLKELQLDKKYLKPISDNYERLLDKSHKESKSDITTLKRQASELKAKIEKLEERYAIGEISYDIFNKYTQKYTA